MLTVDYRQTLNLPKTAFPMKANLAQLEPQIQQRWEEMELYRRSLEQPAPNGRFILHDGPPYSNGDIHMGHALNKILKDIIVRYRGMQGYQAPYVPGWDNHGMPIENNVSREFRQKGVVPTRLELRRRCREYAHHWIAVQREQFKRLGIRGDWEHPYLTMDHAFEAKVVDIFGELAEAGFIYRGLKPVHWCPNDETALAEAEVEYGPHTSPSIYVRFPLRQDPEGIFGDAPPETCYTIIWTTTPWTIPANLAVAVHPDETYAVVDLPDFAYAGRYLIAEKLLRETLDAIGYRDREPVVVSLGLPGTDLQGLVFGHPLFDRDSVLLTAPYVTMDAGTGVVHTASGHGREDFELGQAHGLPALCPVDEQGIFTDEAGPFAGLHISKQGNQAVLDALTERGALLHQSQVEHQYPHCWRCHPPLIYYAQPSWYIRTTQIGDALLRENEATNWYPEHIKHGRYGDWLNNNIDWALSRTRYWGTPLPIWRCEDDHQVCVGSRAELSELTGTDQSTLDPHRPYVDDIAFDCPTCGKESRRVPEVIDAWFDSGSMPFAQWGYPHAEGSAAMLEDRYPADFICEAIDQTRGWFYSLLAISTLLFDKAPFENCIVMGLVQDKDGIKMSKHKGNVVDPWDALGKQGADAVRWYFYSNSQPWLPSRYSDAAVSEGQRKFMGTLWNTYSFYVLYANIDRFNPDEHRLDRDSLTVMDRWILSRLNSLIGQVDGLLDVYDITTGARLMVDFLDDLSNWYVRRGRERYWADDMTDDKVAAYMTLYTVLKQVVLLAAPFVPFLAEDIYQNLVRNSEANAPASVHFCDYPSEDKSFIDPLLEERMAAVLEIIGMGRAARNTSAMKNRQPLSRILVGAPIELPDSFAALITDELNIKKIEFIKDDSALQDYRFKPQLRTLGRRFGKNLSLVSEILGGLNGRERYAELNEHGKITIEVNGQAEDLTTDDLLIETVQVEGFQTEQNRDYIVAIDLQMTEDLIEEGYVREIISKIQTMRKESDFEITDRIVVHQHSSEVLQRIFDKHSEMIAAEVLALRIEALDEADPAAREWSINGEISLIKLEKALMANK